MTSREKAREPGTKREPRKQKTCMNVFGIPSQSLGKTTPGRGAPMLTTIAWRQKIFFFFFSTR